MGDYDSLGDTMDTDLKLFPLSQYRFIDPCKKCLVGMVCKDWCENKYKEFTFKLYKIQVSTRFKKLQSQFIKNTPLYIVWGLIIWIMILFGRLCIELRSF